jgi:hypothetical protein
VVSWRGSRWGLNLDTRSPLFCFFSSVVGFFPFDWEVAQISTRKEPSMSPVPPVGSGQVRFVLLAKSFAIQWRFLFRSKLT